MCVSESSGFTTCPRGIPVPIGSKFTFELAVSKLKGSNALISDLKHDGRKLHGTLTYILRVVLPACIFNLGDASSAIGRLT